MIKHLRSLSKDSLIYGLGNASASIMSFLLLPLYTRYLTPGDYGILAVFAMYQAIIELTIAFGLSSGLFRYFLMSDTEDEKRRVLGTCFLIQAGLMVILALGLFASGSLISHSFFKSGAETRNLHLVTGTALLGALPTLFYSLMRAERKTTLFAGVMFGRTFALAICNILLVAVFKMSYVGVIIANLVVAGLLMAALSPFYFRKFLAPFSTALFRRILVFIAPIYLINVFGFLLSMSDRFFLTRYLTSEQVGLYSFGSKIGSAITIGLITPFSTAVVPYALSIAKREDFREVFAAIIRYFAIAAAFCSISIFLFSKELIYLVGGHAFSGAWVIVGPTLLSGVFYGLYYAISIQLDIIEKTYLSSFAVAAGGIANVLLNLALIPKLGIYGSAVAACCSNALLLIIMFVFCQRNYRVPHDLGVFTKLMIVVAASAGFFLFVESEVPGSLNRIGLKIVFLGLMPAVLFMSGILNGAERNAIRRAIAKFKPASSDR